MATLYNIDKDNFEKISRHQAPDLSLICSERLTFHHTHKGLIYVLSIGQTAESIELVTEIFYPSTFEGRPLELETLDLYGIDNNLNPDIEPAFYLDPAKISAINTFLKTVDEESFVANFDPEELNSEDIYPGKWNDESKQTAFNQTHLLEDFRKLKNFFTKASMQGCYILSDVG